MLCTEFWRLALGSALMATVCGCSAPRGSATTPSTAERANQTPLNTQTPTQTEVGKTTPSHSASLPERVVLDAPRQSKSWAELRVLAAQRMVAASPAHAYTGEVPDPLLAIPVLEIELNADGSIHNISVMRKPTQALDTIELAKEYVRRAAPFGKVSHLPKPWKFVETFLFAEDRRFKPRTLDN